MTARKPLCIGGAEPKNCEQLRHIMKWRLTQHSADCHCSLLDSKPSRSFRLEFAGYKYRRLSPSVRFALLLCNLHCNSKMASFAATVRINPEGASPILSADQLWRGLQFKGRNPKVSPAPRRAEIRLLIDILQEFVPMITSAEVLKETDEGHKVRGLQFEEMELTHLFVTVHSQGQVRRKRSHQRDCSGVRAEHGISFPWLRLPFGALD